MESGNDSGERGMATRTGGDELLVEHERSFHNFVRLLQFSIAGIIILLALMAFFLL